MVPNRFKIKSLVYEHVYEDGSVEDVYLEDSNAMGLGLGHIKLLAASPNPDEPQRFWIASSHDGITNGTNVIATPVPDSEFDKEVHRDRTNTMIGLIRDGACTAYAIYTPGPVGMTKP